MSGKENKTGGEGEGERKRKIKIDSHLWESLSTYDRLSKILIGRRSY
jgi:hypothetical protein